jgi:tetratricopeptide (TPR) repeat protein
MVRDRTRPNSIVALTVCTLNLWLFIPSESAGILQAVAEENEPPTFLTWPEKGLGLSIDLAGFKKDLDQVKPDGRRYLMASHPKTGLNVSVTLEIVPTQATAQGCLDQLKLIQNSPLATRSQDIAFATAGKLPTLEYILHKFEGVLVDQKNVYACLAQKDVYADIHLSKVQYTAADAPLFQSILNSARLQTGPSEVNQRQTRTQPPPQIRPQIQPPAPPNSRELLDLGNALYRQSNYAQAISPYQKAFELEKVEPQLDRNLWRVLIGNLGMAYGMTGRLKEARATFEQGIQADPAYPMFHYNLASTFAGMNDLDHAMQSLTAAFRYRKNQSPGEKGMPDPRQDSSFQRFMKNETFRALVNDLTATKG